MGVTKKVFSNPQYLKYILSLWQNNGYMNKWIGCLFIVVGHWACTTLTAPSQHSSEFVIAFGSCNDQKRENFLWDVVAKNHPSVWIWGGDNTYSDTENMDTLRRNYNKVLQNLSYQTLQKTTRILGTWDDHDYGLNDGGVEFKAKKGSQQLFLDFMGVSKNDKRRRQEGVYHAESFKTPHGSVKIIVLDTRYFRTALTKATEAKKRYQPNRDGIGTMLGVTQWQWLEKELTTSKAQFNVIMSSVQLLSSEHGFETWGNMPHEVEKFKQVVKASKAKGVIVLSGDRHISEFSKAQIEGLNYPLIDFTSSGLTHVYSSFKAENNPYRVGEVVPKISFGLLRLDFKKNTITMQMKGIGDVLYQEMIQKY